MGAPSKIKEHARILRPRIGVVTNVGQDHYKNYRTLEATALEKGRLIEWLPREGVSILNADDPRLLAMACRTAARVMTYGKSPDADLRATDISGASPDRLSLTVVHGNERLRLHTRFLRRLLDDRSWPRSRAASPAASTSNPARMPSPSAACLRPAVPCIRSPTTPTTSWNLKKAALWTVANSFALMRSTPAPRKTMIFGTISDYPGSGSRTYRKVARQALDVVDRSCSSVRKQPYGQAPPGRYQGQVVRARDKLSASAHLASSAVPSDSFS